MLEAIIARNPIKQIYVEDVFSTYLYIGNGTTQSINNGIDLAGEGGLVWIKDRVANQHVIMDSMRGVATTSTVLNSASAAGAGNDSPFDATSPVILSLSSTGFNLGRGAGFASSNQNGTNYASWTLRKTRKFFDVVTYTGNGTNRTIAHNLGSVPGMIVVKRLDSGTNNWKVYHRSLTSAAFAMQLNEGGAGQTSQTTIWNSTAPTDTNFSVGTDSTVNASGGNYVAYLYAHNAGGFGNSGADNIITCGSFTPDASGNVDVNLGYEPQYILMKYKNGNDGIGWWVFDTMREFSYSLNKYLLTNSQNGEATNSWGNIAPTSTGFRFSGFTIGANYEYIYMAIRRGPMRTPTDATKVFKPEAWTGANVDFVERFIGTFASDTVLSINRTALVYTPSSTNPGAFLTSKLLNTGAGLQTMYTNAERTFDQGIFKFNSSSITFPNANPPFNLNGETFVGYALKRAPGFFDVVAYTGTGSAQTISHNLGVVPELMIIKSRSLTESWAVYASPVGNTKYLRLNGETLATISSSHWNNTSPTSTVFTVGTNVEVNSSGATYVAYLFASLAGISKVGSFTGNGSSQNIDCGFSNGARFVLIKRTDDNPSTSDWYVWDTARGIVSANDPYIRLNESTAEVTTNDSIDPLSTGFTVNQVAATNINANAATYIYLAIA